MSDTARKLEGRILGVSAAFVFSLFGLILIGDSALDIGLPTCITDIKPFQKGEVIFHDPLHYEIHYVARMWKYEPENVEVPVDSTVDIYLSTADVTHGFDIINTNVNLMAVPGVVNYARVKFDKPGDYEVLCHEYCGTGHQNMATLIHVYDPTVARATAPSRPAATPSHPGYALLEEKSCTACHTIDGRPGTGPTFRGIYGSKVELADGSAVTVDDAYIRESIRQPNAKVVKGFTPVMPVLPVTDAEIDQITAFIKTLK